MDSEVVWIAVLGEGTIKQYGMALFLRDFLLKCWLQVLCHAAHSCCIGILLVRTVLDLFDKSKSTQLNSKSPQNVISLGGTSLRSKERKQMYPSRDLRISKFKTLMFCLDRGKHSTITVRFYMTPFKRWCMTNMGRFMWQRTLWTRCIFQWLSHLKLLGSQRTQEFKVTIP